MLGDEALVWAVIEDVESSPLGEPEKALFRFVQKLNRDNANVGQADVDALLTTGWTEEAVYDAVSVCALFNFYNRWIDGTGVPDMPKEHYQANAKRMAVQGYVRE